MNNLPKEKRNVKTAKYRDSIKDNVNFKNVKIFSRNRLISVGLEPVIIHTKKLCPASYYIQFFYEYKNWF